MPTLRRAVLDGQRIMALGCGDPIGARVAAQAGFPAVYMSGYFAAACIGYPDVGLATMSEMVEQARRICQATPLPVIADIDTGYGNSINVIRTVREFEAAGVQAVHMEDQDLPKKCGDLPGLALISVAEMCAKVQAAAEARRSDDFLIIARTDAKDVRGLAEAIARGRAYRKAGADMLMIHGLESAQEFRIARAELDGPLVTTVGARMNMPASDVFELGFQVLMYSVTLLRAGIRSMLDTAQRLKNDGIVDHTPAIPMTELHDFLGLRQVADWERRYAFVETPAR